MNAVKTFTVVRHDGSREIVEAAAFQRTEDGYLDFSDGDKTVALAAPGWSVVAESEAMLDAKPAVS